MILSRVDGPTYVVAFELRKEICSLRKQGFSYDNSLKLIEITAVISTIDSISIAGFLGKGLISIDIGVEFMLRGRR